jgi:hypothetical protein
MEETTRSNLHRAAVIGAVLALACSTSTPTEITNVWRDPSYAAGPMKNLIVFGGRMNATNRRSLEDGFVSALNSRGVHATASYTLFPGDLPTKDQARAALQRTGIDGVLVASMRGKNEQTTFVPGAYAGGGFWDGYYGPGWGGPYDPGYVVTDEFVKFETSVWDPRDSGKMVWSAVTETENPSSGKDFVSSLTKSVIPALTDAKILPPPPKGNAVSFATAGAPRSH